MARQHPLKPNGNEWDRQAVFDIVISRLDTMSIPEALQAGHDGRGLPGAPLFGKWVSENPQWQEAIAHARKSRAAHLVEQALIIADSDVERTKDGRIDPGAVRQAELRINQRKWMAGKMDRATYGEQVQVDMNVHGSIDITSILSEARGRVIEGKAEQLPAISEQPADDISDLLG